MTAGGLVGMLLFGRQMLRTLRYLFATTGQATVIRFAFIGKDGGGLTLFRLLVDVHEPSGSTSTFRAEMRALLDETHARCMREGHRIRVKYFGGVPTSVLYDGELEGIPGRV
jgi:hypothetical protein